ncbi:ferritin-like domain-containing protein [Aquiflexum sp. TKW24L]|uniref:YciE/YciF ferroxidase family protein n=1 Tax=Aquiflexum sp. TKW24L TaxID=2942212 RepID=UPI0020BD8479|nr:ferritin-like domain-containing protein [Aquiflexum sp. TKW24L]MCL6261076.1 ferritin-like domain-containing protein [Aquiflexum sp. TKW24L]
MEKKNNTSDKSSAGSARSGSGNKATMKSSQLMELFEDGLKDIYWAEKALLKAMPKMTKNATSEELIEALTSHLEETKGQITRLEEVFALIKVKAEAKKCDAMEGLIEEASGIMEDCEKGSMRDAGIIAAAQKVEHYEIASYGTLRQFAETLGLTDVEVLLATTLQEEKEADLKLSDVAMAAINVEAAGEPA